jgi:putative RNA 2'-phosphotransferase
MNPKKVTKISKYLSYHLRHKPEEIGLTLETGGWVAVDQLLKAAEKHDFPISREELNYVVENSDKKRFSFDETGSKIRANQGHSVTIDLELKPITPPDILYHGTGEKYLTTILEQGLLKMSRHHVHLSADLETAKKVGQRKGKVVIFTIDAKKMRENNYQFFCSDNGVWLVDHVPPEYLSYEIN